MNERRDCRDCPTRAESPFAAKVARRGRSRAGPYGHTELGLSRRTYSVRSHCQHQHGAVPVISLSIDTTSYCVTSTAAKVHCSSGVISRQVTTRAGPVAGSRVAPSLLQSSRELRGSNPQTPGAGRWQVDGSEVCDEGNWRRDV